ncbi:MAG: methylated-DNA--[protein]-cysteine S-methyltransferase [Pontimonas sp.]|nr:methylated-DNA--[protein]-cysteine S-methyltransferase [Pontimonas sp.]
MNSSLTMDSPLGPLTITASNQTITAVTIGKRPSSKPSVSPADADVLHRAARQLGEYFEGSRTAFDLPLHWSGTRFQEAIWSELTAIPFGEKLTYDELGQRAGLGRAPRAVGGAVGRNPIPIIVPCHRVLGASGTITGYSAGDGIPTKEKLLRHEGIDFR